jgi:hypothetical protein
LRCSMHAGMCFSCGCSCCCWLTRGQVGMAQCTSICSCLLFSIVVQRVQLAAIN